jgi:competence protein ComEC
VRYPAAPPAIALLGGAALGVRWQAEPSGLAAALVLGAVLGWLSWRQRLAAAFVAAALAAFAACGLALAGAASHRATHSDLRAALVSEFGTRAIADGPGDPVMLVGRLDADGALVETGARLALSVEGIEVDGLTHRAPGGVLLTVAGDVPPALVEQWRRGRTLRLPAQLRRPSRYLNPGAGDEELALARRGTTLVGGVKSAMLVQVIRRGSWPAEAAAALRLRTRRIIEDTVGLHSARSAAIVRAVLLGDRAGLDDETERRLQEAGTYHVLAISGGNIAILAAVLMAMARLAGFRPGFAHLAVAGALVGYAYLVGGGASVVRATQMAALYLVALAADHRAKAFNTVAASAVLSIAADPLVICDAGAWLTYGATIAILAGTPLLLARVESTALVVRAPAGLLAASVSAEVALFPVSALVFSRVTAAGLVLNFAAIPLMTVVQCGGMALVAASVLLPPAVPLLAVVTHLAAWGLVDSARLVDVMPWTVTRVPAPAPVAVGAYYAAWIAWFAARRWPSIRMPGWVARVSLPWWCRHVAIGIAAACAAWMILTPALRFGRTAFLEATFIDVGQGAATLVRFPSGHAILVDAGGAGGGRFDVGRRVVEPAVWAAGVHRVTHVVATHGDADHIGGAASIVADFRPHEIWEGVPVPPDPLLQQLRAEAGRAGAAWRTVQRRDSVRFGDAEVVAWHPLPPEWERQRVRNEDSVVVEVRFGEVSLLLAGDVEAAAEADIAKLVAPAGVRVVLAPHHGSSTSSTWPLLKATLPDLAIISAGRGNRYGHPHAAVLERYRSVGARVLRTDLEGAIMLRTDGHAAEVTTFTGRRLTLRPRPPAALVPPA